MNEKKKGIVILGIIALFVAFLFLVNYNNKIIEQDKANQGTKVIERFNATLASSTNKMIYIGRTGCSFCQLFTPIITDMKTRYDAQYEYFNTDDLTNDQLSEILVKLGVQSKDFGTPYLAILKDNAVVAKPATAGFLGESDLFNFLKANGIIKSDAKLLINYIDYNQYKTLRDGSAKEVIVVGQTTCSYCLAARPALNEIISQYKIKINYIDITKAVSDDRTAISQELATSVSAEWGTPLMLIVQNGKIIKSSSGFLDKATYVTFLTTNGIIK